MWNNDILIDKTACLACNWESLIFQPRMWRKRFDILGLTTAESTTNVASQKKIYNCGTTTWKVSNSVMEEITKMVKSLEEYVFFIKGVSKTIENEAKKGSEKSSNMLLRLLGVSLFGNTQQVKVLFELMRK